MSAIAARVAHAGMVPAGPEIALGSDAPFRRDPFVCTTATGDFAVAWYNSDGGPRAQLFDAEGSALGPEILVPSGGTFARDPVVACDPLGGFVVAWSNPFDIWFRRFDASGAPLGADVQADGAEDSLYPALSVAGDGTIVVAWRNNETGDTDLRIRRFDATGAPLGAATAAGWGGGGPGGLPVLAHAPAGNFVLAADGVARRFDALGVPEGPTFAIGFDDDDVCFDGTGGSVVVGSAPDGGVGPFRDVVVQRYDGAGAALGSATVVNAATAGGQGDPQVACAADGGFVVSWTGPSGVAMRRFAAGGTPTTDDVRVPETREGNQNESDVAVSGDRVFVVWRDQTIAERTPLQIAARAYCDDGEPDCRYFCPGYDPNVDDDGDGIPNGCDDCTNVGGAQDLPVDSKARLKVRSGGTSGRSSRLVWRGSFVLPPHLVFADLVGRPVRLLLQGPTGDAIDALLDGAGTGSWDANTSGTKLSYRDDGSTPVRGILRATLADRSKKSAGLVKFRFKGAGNDHQSYALWYRLVAGDQEGRVVMVLGTQAAADAGECAEAPLAAAECSFKGPDGIGTLSDRTTLKCKL